MDGEKEIPQVLNGGIFIREYILANGPSSAWELWKAWRELKRSMGHRGPTYQSFWQNYIYPLRQLGLLEVVGEEQAEYENAKPRKLLDVNHAELDADGWFDPKGVLYGGTVTRNVREVRGPVNIIEEYESRRRRKKVKKAKKTTGKARAESRRKGKERARAFIEAYYQQPPEAHVYTPTELRIKAEEVEKKKKKAMRKLRRKKKEEEQAKGAKKTTKSSKAKKSEKKPTSKTKTTKKTKAKNTTSKRSKKKKEEAKTPVYSSVEEMMKELSPEEMALLRKLAGRG